jgi:hypothetical protein
MLKMLAATALLVVAQGDEFKSGIWEAREDVSALDGKRSLSQTLLSRNRPLNSIGRPSVGILKLRCSGRDIDAIVAVPGAFFGTRNMVVKWRVDSSPIREEAWLSVDGHTYAAMTVNKPAQRLLDAIAPGKELVVRVHGYGGNTEIVFDLGNAQAAVNSVRQTCARR